METSVGCPQWQVLEEQVSGDANGTLDDRVWVQQDAKFNVTAITDGRGAVLERYAYDPYGSVTVMNAGWSTLSGSATNWKYLHQGGRLDGGEWAVLLPQPGLLTDAGTMGDDGPYKL